MTGRHAMTVPSSEGPEITHTLIYQSYLTEVLAAYHGWPLAHRSTCSVLFTAPLLWRAWPIGTHWCVG